MKKQVKPEASQGKGRRDDFLNFLDGFLYPRGWCFKHWGVYDDKSARKAVRKRSLIFLPTTVATGSMIKQRKIASEQAQ